MNIKIFCRCNLFPSLSAPLYNGFRLFFFRGVKRPGRGDYHPLPFTTEVKERISYTSTPLLGLHGLF